MSLGNISLKYLEPTLSQQLPDGRLQITRKFLVSKTDLNSDRLQTILYDTYGTLDGVSVVNDYIPPGYQIFATAVLVHQEIRHPLFRQGDGDPQATNAVLEKVYEQASATAIAASSTAGAPTVGKTQYETGPDAVLEATQTFCNQTASGFTPGVIGTDTFTTGQGTGILKEEKVEVGLAVRKVVRRYVISGLFQARLNIQQTGLAYVTFKSIGSKVTPTAKNAGKAMTDPANVAFQGGAATQIIKDVTVDIAGLNTFEVTAVMKYDGTALPEGTCSVTIRSRKDYANYPIPGQVSLGATGSGSTVTLNPIVTLIAPVPQRKLLITVTEAIMDSASAVTTLGTAPFFVQQWASLNVSWVDTASGISRSLARAYQGYLTQSGQTLNYTGGTVNGSAATAIKGGIGSNPNSTGSYPYLSMSGKVLELRCTEAYITTSGVQYYRVKTVTAV